MNKQTLSDPIRSALTFDYAAIRALNPNGYNVQSNDGQKWEIVNGKPTMKIVFHVNHNGTMSGPYLKRSYYE